MQSARSKLILSVTISIVSGVALALALHLFVAASTADSIAIAGVMVSLYQAVVARWTSVPTAELTGLLLQEKRDEVAHRRRLEGSGHVAARVTGNGSSNSKIYLFNDGPVSVTEVAYKLGDTRTLAVSSRISAPYKALKPGAEIEVALVARTMAAPPNFEVEVSWVGPDGKTHTNTVVLHH
jgi:hypothetical protein